MDFGREESPLDLLVQLRGERGVDLLVLLPPGLKPALEQEGCRPPIGRPSRPNHAHQLSFRLAFRQPYSLGKFAIWLNALLGLAACC
ncbi:MAG: hypothetical protein DMF90_29090 [Acidobacteria bacterium]|nr:MAG: hypothetical protein DMF90_29090 [Acidobacteriota bacterium]